MTPPLPECVASSAEILAGKYLTFSLEKECYAIGVLHVREIIRVTEITPVPQVPIHVKGVINLRGKIIPVVDLQVALGLSNAGQSYRSCIVVVQVQSSQGVESHLGLLVDQVEEVVHFGAANIEGTPDFGPDIHTRCILGMAKLGAKVAILLDIQKVMTETQVLP